MEGLLAALEGLAPIAALRFSRWTYAAINTGHVFAIALLVGGTVPLSLRLMGLWPSVQRADVVRILALTAGVGLALGVLTGSLLFATRATEYIANPAFQIKLGFIGVAVGSVFFANIRYGWDLMDAPGPAVRRAATVSLICWIGALTCGRLIAFVEE